MRVRQSAGTREHFKNWIRYRYGKGYSISSIITNKKSSKYGWGTYTAVLKQRRFLRNEI